MKEFGFFASRGFLTPQVWSTVLTVNVFSECEFRTLPWSMLWAMDTTLGEYRVKMLRNSKTVPRERLRRMGVAIEVEILCKTNKTCSIL